MLKVWDGSDWLPLEGVKYWNGTGWDRNNKSKVRSASAVWLPQKFTDKDVSYIVKWNVEGRTPPATPDPVTAVPNIVGLTQAAAISALQAATLNIGDITYFTTTTLANDGKIASQSVQPLLHVPQNSFVNFVVYEYKVPTATVPQLNGLLRTAAESAITSLGFVVGTKETIETYDTTLIGKVVPDGQYPVPGTVADVGTLVNFDYYIQKPFVTMPQLIGIGEYEVFSALYAAGLNEGTKTTTETTNKTLEGKVKTQQYNAGQQLQAGTAVNYNVYIPNTTTIMPNIVGKTPAQASTLLQAAELWPGTETTQETTNVSLEGTIASAQYGAGTTRPVDSTVNYVVYIPNTTTTVPNIVNQTTATATSLLTTAELYLGYQTAEVQTSNTTLHNKIAAQSPASGSVQPVHSSVNYTLYVPLKTAAVPSIIGQTISVASQTLSAAGFILGYQTGTSYTTNSAQVGTIVTQSLTGTQNIGATVNYTTYILNPNTTVPNIVGQYFTTANTTLVTANLNVGTVTEVETTNSAQVGYVQSQSVASGSSVVKGTTVNYVKYKAKVLVPVTTTKTGTAYIWSPQVSSYYGSGSRRASGEPAYFGQWVTSTGDQFSLINVTDSARDSACFAVSGNRPYTITSAKINFTQASGVGNTTKNFYFGTYPQAFSGLPGSATKSSISNNQYVSSSSNGQAYSLTLNNTIKSHLFTYPSYAMAVNSATSATSGYGQLTGISFTLTIQWTETTYV